MNTDGSGLRLLDEDSFWADWSPDGSIVIYPDQLGNITLIQVDTQEKAQLILENRSIQEVKWSPDGAYLAVRTEMEVIVYEPACIIEEWMKMNQ